MLKLTINGREIRAAEGQTLLEAAKENLIYIPTLCNSEAVAAYGACRLCLVEITTGRGRKRLVASCLYPVEEGLSVKTSTERVDRVRRVVLQLLMARCPDAKEVQEMARGLGIEGSPFPAEADNRKCILCALCARTCKEVVGVSAISLVNRGVQRQLATPFFEPSEACIGCGSCAYICPTNAISIEDVDGRREVKWPHSEMEFEMARCKVCGAYFAPKRQLEHIAKISGTPVQDTCPTCRD